MTKTKTRSVKDQPQRQQALSPDTSFIVQAPAGSGKTGILIQRYLKLLSLVEAPEEIIAITFTRKAATEMQGRVLAALEEAIADKPVDDNDYERTTRDLAEQVLSRDEALGWQLTGNPARLRVQTIDALCASLVKQMPLLSGLGSQPDMAEDPSELYQQAVKRTLDELESSETWSDAIADLIVHLDNNLPQIGSLLEAMLTKRDQWLGYVMQEHDRKDMERALAHIMEEQLARAAEFFPEEAVDELLALLDYAAENLSKDQPDHPIMACQGAEGLPATDSSGLKSWHAICGLLLTGAGTWRKQCTVKQGFPSAAGAKGEEAGERKQRKEEMKDLIARLQAVDGLHEALVDVSLCPPASYSDAEWRIIEALCELLKLSAGQLELVCAEQSQVDFIGVAQAAVRALGDDEAPTDLALALDYQIKHILVDEYQDISASQYRLLDGLTREWSEDDGRSLFLVGDPMQSIYRFREADVSIFIRTFHEERLGTVELTPLRLTVNFRSEQGIVDWFNKSFKQILPDKDDVISGAVSFNKAIAMDQSPDKDKVKVYPSFSRSDEKEATETVEIIKGLKEQADDQTIAILVRGRTHLNIIIPELRKAGISFSAVDIEGLGEQPAIHDLLSLTRAYLYPADRIAWLACLRAPWCGLTTLSLYHLCNGHHYRTLWECITDEEITKQLEPDEQQRLARFVAIMAPVLEECQRYSLRKTIETVWIQLGGPATLKSETELANCEAYFGLLEELDCGGGLEDVHALQAGVEALFAVPEQLGDNPVQIMTIHKAKGLEFDHVILPGLGRPPRGDQGKLLVWLLRQVGDEEELILAPIREAGEEQAPIYDYINRIDRAKLSLEEVRLIYVATTRARHSLHLMGHVRTKEDDDDCYPNSRSLLNHLWPVVQETYLEHLPDSVDEEETGDDVPLDQTGRRLPDDWCLPDALPPLNQPAAVDQDPGAYGLEFEWAGETIMHIGSLVHRVIELIAGEGIAAWDDARIAAEQPRFDRLLKQMGVPDEERPKAVEDVSLALCNMLSDERGRWILADTHQESQYEWPLSGVYRDGIVNTVIDRTFIDEDGVRWIIDYKLSRHEGADQEKFFDQQQERYQSQMEKYATLISQLGEEEVRLGLYFPLLKGWRAWDFNAA